MKKFTLQLGLILILFLIINTSYFWEGELGLLSIVALLMAFIIYFILFVEFVFI